MKIGSPFPQDGPPRREAVTVEHNSRSKADDTLRDKLTLSDNVKAWLGGASEGPEMLLPPKASPAYSEATIRSKGKVEASLSPEKMAAIQDRIQSGFYSQEAVKRIVAGRMAEEIVAPSESAD